MQGAITQFNVSECLSSDHANSAYFDKFLGSEVGWLEHMGRNPIFIESFVGVMCNWIIH